jgi:hypothetical protein
VGPRANLNTVEKRKISCPRQELKIKIEWQMVYLKNMRNKKANVKHLD